MRATIRSGLNFQMETVHGSPSFMHTLQNCLFRPLVPARLGDKAGATEAARTSTAAAHAQGRAAAAEYRRLDATLLASLK